jgi:hypothetical protein
MALRELTLATLRRSFALYDELVEALPEPAFSRKLPGLRSNTIGQQLWCVVGARESYGRAVVAGAWDGFACSLAGDRCGSRADVAAALCSSAADSTRIIEGADPWTDSQGQLVLDLVEHETMHHGQLIRYLYGLDLFIPAGWKARYALT